MTPEPVGARLRRLRVERNLTLEALAERSGVSVRGISDIERGLRTAPRHLTVVALAEALELQQEDRDALFAAVRSARMPLAVSGSLPARPFELPDFTGRRDELDSIAALLALPGAARGSSTPIVLSGPPGIGKTSIAVHAASQGAHGRPVYYVNLGGASPSPMTPLQVMQALLRQAPDVPQVPAVLAEAVETWVSCAEALPAVVVLDDAGGENQVRPALHAGSSSDVIITSRRTLAGLEAVRHLTVGRWSRDESVAFLRSAIPQDLGSDADLAALAELCGDLPLALRISAGRVSTRPMRTAADLERRLRSTTRRLRLLTAGDLEVERTFAASYELLAPRQRALFRSLGLLPARSFSPAAAAVTQRLDQEDTLDELEDLVDLGLVEAVGRDRFRLHDLLRIYATGRLEDEVAEADDLQLAVDRWYLGTAVRASDLFAPAGSRGPVDQGPLAVVLVDQAQAGAWLRDEADGWFSALQRLAAAGRHEELLAAARRLRAFAESSLSLGRWIELYTLTVASAAAVGDVRLEAEQLERLAYMYNFETFQPEQALDVASRAVELARAAGEVTVEADALVNVATAHRRMDDSTRAEESLRQAATLYAAADHADGEATVRQALAVLRMDADPAGAAEELRAVLRYTDEHAAAMTAGGRMLSRTNVLGSLATALTRLGRTTEAVDHATRAIDESGADSGALARSHAHRGFARLAAGDRPGGTADLHEALRLAGRHRPQYWADQIEQALGPAT